MQTFVKHILKVVLMLVISACVLDFVYTYVYKNSPPQNKVQYINSLKNQKFDYIFIGSSRVENSVIAEEIEKKTNKKTINLGIKGLKLKDMSCIIKLLKEYNVSYQKIFIQLDYSFNNEEESSKFFSFELLPFCGSSNLIIDSYLKSTNENFLFYKYIPFVKYTDSDQLIGFRKIISSLKNKPSAFKLNKGYEPLYGFSSRQPEKIPKIVNKKNKYFSEINIFAKSKNLNVIYFSSPVSSDTKNLDYFDKLKTQIPEINNFHNTLNDHKYFSDNLHVNDDGAIVFTTILIEKLKL
jgi:hypothetical protein